MPETPRYQVMQRSFYAPNIIEPGSIIETDSMPGNHLYPLNDAARAKMEEWYAQEDDKVDKEGKLTGEKWKPHEQYRIRTGEAGQTAQVEVISGPPKEARKALSLAEAMLAPPKTDQRPGPAPASILVETDDGTKILEAVAPPSPTTINKK